MSPADFTESLALRGHAVLRQLLTVSECAELAQYFDDDACFRSTIDMARYRFGQGTYRYFSYPLPAKVQDLRRRLYATLVPVANRWAEALGETPYPPEHAQFLERCRAAGQLRPTPLLLRYQPGDYNCLHQDLYGPCVFPLQLVCLLNEPGRHFEGGELVLTEQRPRAQSAPHVVPLRQGDAAVIATHHFPRRGARGYYRANLRHGVSAVRSGCRHTLGVVFHDAA